MIFAHTADWHLGKDIDVERNQLAAFVGKCAELRVEVVVIAGDIFERPNVCTPKYSTGAVQTLFLQTIHELRAIKIIVIVVRGNHDYMGPGCTDALCCIEGTEGVHVVREPNVIKFPGKPVQLFCLPWEYDAEAEQIVREQLTPVEDGEHTVRILTGHIQVLGALMGAKRTKDEDSGLAREFCMSREFLDEISPLFARIAFGDFHKRQDLTNGKGGFVGALRQLTHGEEGNPAGFEIFDTDTETADWIELDAAPYFKTIQLENEEPVEPVAREHCRGSVSLRIRCIGYDPTPEDVRGAERLGAKVEVLCDVEERVQRVDDLPEGIADDHRALIRLWCEQQLQPTPEHEVQNLLNLFDSTFADETSGTEEPGSGGDSDGNEAASEPRREEIVV